MRPIRFLVPSWEDALRTGDVGGVGRVETKGLRCRSDLRDAGVLNASPGAFLFRAGVTLFMLFVCGAFFAPVPFLGVPFTCGVLVVCFPARFVGSGVGGGASRFTRDDFLTPFSKTVVGPSALKDLQGGDAARDAERGVDVDVDDSSTLRRFAGRCMTPPSSTPSSCAATCSSFIGTLTSSFVLSPLNAVLYSLSVLLASWWGLWWMSKSTDVTCSIQDGE